MAEKDITEKILEDYNDVFADIVNVLLFDGKEVIHKEELLSTRDKSQYKADDSKIHEQERDVAKFWNRGKVRLALCGLENQTDIDKDIPLRIIGYDGAAYRSELLSGRKERYPVITLVLYFGMNRWTKPHSLSECMDIPEYLEPYVSDYKINVFEIAYLTKEQVSRFQSDFKIVADYFVQKRKDHDYKPSQDTIRHVDELLKLMAVLTEDDRYVKVQANGKGSEKNMCEILDKVEARGEKRGLFIGRNQGKVEAYADMGLSASEIAERMEIPEEEVERLLELKF